MGLVVKQGKDKFRWVMRQAFGTAEANFEAIQDENIPLLVPYGKEGRHILAKLLEKIRNSFFCRITAIYGIYRTEGPKKA